MAIVLNTQGDAGLLLHSGGTEEYLWDLGSSQGTSRYSQVLWIFLVGSQKCIFEKFFT
jgi:hypothetical protein